MKLNNQKRACFIVFFAIVLGSMLHANKLTMVGVVDMGVIVSDYFRESSAWREIDELTRRTEETINQRMEEINRLRERRIEAVEARNERLALQLEEEIRGKQEFLQEYHRVMNNRINTQRENLMTSSQFSGEIIDTIAFVAESEGISVVFRKTDPNIVYYSYEVDITEKVLTQLRRRAGGR